MRKVLNLLPKILIATAIIVGIGTLGYMEHKYTIAAEVSTVYNDTVVFTDTRGHTWVKNCDSKNYEIGENVKLVMHDAATNTVVDDDYILEVTK